MCSHQYCAKTVENATAKTPAIFASRVPERSRRALLANYHVGRHLAVRALPTDTPDQVWMLAGMTGTAYLANRVVLVWAVPM